jgi:hypothetical protein
MNPKLADLLHLLADHTRRYCAANDQFEARMNADRWIAPRTGGAQ